LKKKRKFLILEKEIKRGFFMQAIPLKQFIENSLLYLDRIVKNKEELVITKEDNPYVTITPYTDNPLKNTITFEENIVDPIDEIWDASK
jgi:hypothetical protein